MENILSLINTGENGVKLTAEHGLWADVIRRTIFDCDPKHKHKHYHSEATWLVFCDPESTGFTDILDLFGDGERLLESIRKLVTEGRIYETGHKRRWESRRQLDRRN